MRFLSYEENEKIVAGQAITVAAILAVLVAAIVTVVVYKLFTSSKGTTTLPGGWKFTWN